MGGERRTRLASAAITALVVVAALTGSVGAMSGTSESSTPASADSPLGQSETAVGNETSAFVVDLSSDGSARVTLRLTYNLSEEADRTGFERLEANASTFAQSYANRLEPLAARASNETSRQMVIRDPTAQFVETDSTGIVELSATWTNVATHRDGQVVLAEPFDDGFDPERPFVVRGPDGYELESATPNPAVKTATVVAWNTSESLDDLSVTFESTDSDTDQPADETTTTSTEMPLGPAPILALLGVVGALAVLGRRD
ncbi:MULTISPECIES: hypothetical protein [Haloferax]|uniref:DUF7345 domain-containing protein n=1 Tax=Haloferax marinum TaxID=2666143 RepID=A0A6A8G4S2_9EURY|nr:MULTISPECIES: hypothetical protein [Haloferax]KAB1196360.1 hypothetical protein Hfx1150_02040 [Haloferax sp. CBA1150]MRW95353.1 hypothetical protein [Haloferax marinum]